MARSPASPPSPKPLRFDGVVHVDAPQQLVWDTLQNPEQLAAAAPGEVRYATLDETHFQIATILPIGRQGQAVTAQICWLDVREPEHLQVEATLLYLKHPLQLLGSIDLSTHTETHIAFAIDILPPPTFDAVPRKMIHSIAVRLITQFFRQFKDQVETAALDAAGS